jgi:hypothetical protein
MKAALLLLVLSLFSGIVSGQTTVVSGYVKDAVTGAPLSFVRVKYQYTSIGAYTDTSGFYSIKTKTPGDTLEFISIGYEIVKIPVTAGENKTFDVLLTSSATSLGEVVVESGENPAYRILDSFKVHRKENDPESRGAYQCEVYNRVQLDINNLDEHYTNGYRKLTFIGDYVDTADGEYYLPVVLTESISDYYFRNPPVMRKEVIKATRVTGVEYLQLTQYTGDIYQNVNIYEDYIDLFARDFMSPVADGARVFYKHYLQDNDTIDGRVYYHIAFKPRRNGESLFEGEMWIADSSFAIAHIIAIIPDDVNLNYVSDFRIEQVCTEVAPGAWMLTTERAVAHFDVFNEKDSTFLPGLTAHKNTTRRNFVFDQPKDLEFYALKVEIEDSAELRDENYWLAQRHEQLNEEEQGVIDMVDSLKQNRTFRFYENVVYLSTTGFWRLKNVEVGNVFSLYNRNVVEGHRVMISLRTTNRFSRKVEISAFGIYGFLDEEFKYGGSVRWKLSHAPRVMLRFAYKHKIEQLGLSSSVGDIGNSFSTLLSSGPLDKLTMVDKAAITMEKDWKVSLRTFHSVELKKFTPLGSSDYSRVDIDGDTIKVGSLTSFEIRNQFMFVKDEKFLAGQFDRISLGTRKPIISVTHTWGIKDILGSEYNFHRLDVVWDHRPKIGFLGKLHYSIYGGKIFGQVPYPFLEIHQGNETYYTQINSMNMLNYYEFISDEWIGINFEHYLMGFITDRIPLIKKLEWRLLWSAKMLVGRYNNKHETEMLLPYYSHELTKPYYEISAGIENIFKFIRVDAIWRLSYRDHLNLYGEPIPDFGVKINFALDF